MKKKVVKEVIEGSEAVSQAVKLCRPDVISAYPITPQTHIVEQLAKMVADGKLDTEYVTPESEFGAISVVAGSSATGVRTYTATASQGLALMHEVLCAVSGMRLPIVMTVANRSLNSPLSIWNDHQDSMAERDSGWIQLFCETNQEVHDTTIQAYKIAENENVLLPIMVCMDGFTLTHTYEPVDTCDQNKVDEFLPRYKATKIYLDPKRPMSQGAMAFPDTYYKFKIEQEKVMQDSAKVVQKVHDEFAKKFGRKYGNGLVENYGKGDTVFVAAGSVCGTIKDFADENDVSLLRIRAYRPFPKQDVLESLRGKKTVIVLDKAVAYGLNCGQIFSDIALALYGEKEKPKLVDWIGGLAGQDITLQDLKNMLDASESMKNLETRWLTK